MQREPSSILTNLRWMQKVLNANELDRPGIKRHRYEIQKLDNNYRIGTGGRRTIDEEKPLHSRCGEIFVCSSMSMEVHC